MVLQTKHIVFHVVDSLLYFGNVLYSTHFIQIRFINRQVSYRASQMNGRCNTRIVATISP